MTEGDRASLADKAREFDKGLWELYQLAKEINGSNYMGDGNKWKKLEDKVAEVSKVEGEFAYEACSRLRTYKED